LYRVVNKDKKVGFIDRTGRLVIGFNRLPAGVEVGDFSEGLASICFPNESGGDCRGVGFIDETGEIVIAPRFKHATKFSEGLAYVEAEGLVGFIDRRGEVAIKLKETERYVSDFHEGLALVLTDQGLGFIDRAGKWAINARYSYAESFSEGLAAATISSERGAKYGFINKEGQMVIPPRFGPRVEIDPERVVAIDTPRFSEGLARVRVGDLYGYINKQGEFVIPPQFPYAGDFSEGLANVAEKGKESKAGFIDKSGRWVITPRFALGSHAIFNSFKGGLAPVAVEIKPGIVAWGYIDRNDKMVIEPRFVEACPFDGDVALVYVADASRNLAIARYIDKTGKYLWEPQ
jgi:hypothetical protein